MVNGQIKVAGTTDNGTRIGCMKKFDAVLLLVMVVSAGFVRAENAKEVVVASTEALKGIRQRRSLRRRTVLR